MVHGLVGVFQDVGGGCRVGRAQGDADAGRDIGHVVAELEGLAEGLDDVFGNPLNGRPLGHAGQQHGEFVAALAGHGVRFAQAGNDAPGGFDQQAVAGFVAEGVVHFLEAVQVDEHHRDAVVGAVGALDEFGQPVVEQAAVGQAGERVVVGLHPDQGFGLFSLGDVGDHADQSAELAVGFEIRGLAEDHVAALATGQLDRGFVGWHARVVYQGLVVGVVALGQIRWRQLEYRAPDDRVAGASEEGFEGLVAADVAALFVLEEQRAGDGLDELGGEVELLGGGAFGGTPGGDVDQHADDGRLAGKLGAGSEDFQLQRPPLAMGAVEGVVRRFGASVDALVDGFLHLVQILGLDQIGGAEAAADVFLGVAEHFGKTRVHVTEEPVLDDVDADQRVAQKAKK